MSVDAGDVRSGRDCLIGACSELKPTFSSDLPSASKDMRIFTIMLHFACFC